MAMCLVVATLAGVLARHAWSSIVDYHPPYNFGESPIEPTTPPWSENVVLIIVDGLRLDMSYQLPEVNRLRNAGADFEALAGSPSFSLPARANFVTGAWPEIHGVTSNYYEKSVATDNLLRLAARHRRSVAIAGIAEWSRLFGKDLKAAGGEFLAAPPKSEEGHYAEAMTALEIFADQSIALWSAKRPNLMIIDFPATDRAAHEYGAASDPYRSAAQWIDGKIAMITASLDLTRSTIIVTSDHGHRDQGGHGGTEDIVMRTPLVLAGKGIRVGSKGRAQHIDVAPTVAALLGLPIPAGSAGTILMDALEVDEASKVGRLQQAVRQKQRFARSFFTSLQAAVPPVFLESVNQDQTSLQLQRAAGHIDRFIEHGKSLQIDQERRARLPRFLAVVGILWAGLILYMWTIRSGWGEVKSVGLGVLSYFTVFGALFWTGGLHFSVSAMNKDSDLGKFLGKDMLFAAIAMALALALSIWQGRRSLQPKTWRSLLPVSLIVPVWVVLVLATHIGMTYWQHDLFMRWYLPDIWYQFGSLLSLLQIQAIGGVTVLAPFMLAAVFRWVGPSPPSATSSDTT